MTEDSRDRERDRRELTLHLTRLGDGDQEAADQLFPEIYTQLKRVAANYFRMERPNHTLQPTAVVHEAFINLVDHENVKWKDRAHFFALAAKSMRRILMEHARRRGARKRGGEWRCVSLEKAVADGELSGAEVVCLDEAIENLASIDERKARIVELRFFSGLNIEEIAHVVGVSKRTVETEWRAARAWLKLQLSGEG